MRERHASAFPVLYEQGGSMKLKKAGSALLALIIGIGMVGTAGVEKVKAGEKHNVELIVSTIDIFGGSTELWDDFGGTVVCDKEEAEEGETVHVTATAKEGFELIELGVNMKPGEGPIVSGEFDKNSGEIEFAMPDNAVLLLATFQDVRTEDYTVRFNPGRGSGSMEEIKLDAALARKWVVPECTITPPEGEKFVYWEIDNTPYAVGSTYTVPKSGATLRACFEDPSDPNQQKVSTVRVSAYTMDGEGGYIDKEMEQYGVLSVTGGSIKADKDQAQTGEIVTVTVTPASGYVVDKMCFRGEADPDYYPGHVRSFVMIDEDASVEVYFKKAIVIDAIELTITLPKVGDPVNNDGTGVPAEITVKEGTPVTLTQKYWFYGGDINSNDQGWTTGISPDAFVAGRPYFAECDIYADDGFIFDETTKVTMNGAELAFGTKQTELLNESRYNVCTADLVLEEEVSEPEGDPYEWVDEGTDTEWDGKGDAGFIIEGTGEEDTSFEDFDGIRMDGEVVDPSNYESWKGSLHIKLKEEYLKTLEPGDHVLEVLFKNDVVLKKDFKIAKTNDTEGDAPAAEEAASEAEPTATPTPTPTETPTATPTQAATNGKPKTGDVAPTSRLVALIALYAVGLTAIVLMDRRRKEEE